MVPFPAHSLSGAVNQNPPNLKLPIRLRGTDLICELETLVAKLASPDS